VWVLISLLGQINPGCKIIITTESMITALMDTKLILELSNLSFMAFDHTWNIRGNRKPRIVWLQGRFGNLLATALRVIELFLILGLGVTGRNHCRLAVNSETT
jgi:NADH:ubiquinone oxidoreductase subunit K